MENLSDILNRFSSLSLKDLEEIKLLNRTDLKYTFSENQLSSVLTLLKPHYDVLEIDQKKQISYQTKYYDTPDFKLYHAHHQGKLNRYKVRYRLYENHTEGYLEVKYKNNKGRTIKSRVQQNSEPIYIDPLLSEQLKNIPGLIAERLFPAIDVSYQRLTLIDKQRTEKITFDTHLTFKYNHHIEKIPDLVIAEIKQSQKSTSGFIDIMKQLQIKNTSISKYCLGLYLNEEKVKKNNFKTSFSSIHRITLNYSHDSITTI